MYEFIGQPKFVIDAVNQQPTGYELFIREQQNGILQMPQNFSQIGVKTIERLLLRAIQAMPRSVRMLSFNLEQNQFVDPAFIKMVKRVQDQTTIELFTELTERNDPTVNNEQLATAAKLFHRNGLLVCIDDVGTGENTTELVKLLNRHVDEYKFALQGLRPFNHISEVSRPLSFWFNLAQKHHKMLAIEGVESEEDLKAIQKNYPCDVVQGYFTGRPRPLNYANHQTITSKVRSHTMNI